MRATLGVSPGGSSVTWAPHEPVSAKVAGFCSWGWLDLSYSALDAGTDNFRSKADWQAHGKVNLAEWFLGQGIGCQGARLLPVAVNGTAGFGNFRLTYPGLWEPFAIQVLTCGVL